MPWTPLILDTFIFDEAQLETPEAFGDMGGYQSIEQHDFPGGTRTHKAYGYFPGVQKWRAKFHGMLASDRAEGVKRILSAGREVKLQFGPRAWLGRVAKFTPTARHAWHFEYELEFWPRVDYGSPGPTLPPVTDLGTVLSLHILSIQSLITYGLSPDFIFEAAALEVVNFAGPLGDYAGLVQSSVSLAGGTIASISLSNQQSITQSSLSALSACQPFQASNNPILSSPATDAATRVQAIQALMTTAQPPLATVQTINPNLLSLAAVYYGDSSQWRAIGHANNLADPQPIGSYNLIIPQPS